jgi:SAM-dependent methyltransferase
LRRLTRWAGEAVYRAPGEMRQCPACGSTRLAALATQKLPSALDGRRTGLISGCEECGLVFVNPFPSAAELASMYAPDGEWAQGRADEALTPVHELEGGAGMGTWPRLFEPIRDRLDVTHPPAGARVLDFGCGRGKFLDVLSRCGWETFGIEPAMDVAFARHRRLDRIPSEPQFDLVIANHVLEHVTDPLTLMRQLAAATRPDGHLLVGVPRLDTLPIHRDRSYVISRVHVTAYTSASMLTLLGRAGWQAVAPPADDVPLSGGRRTTARLRVLARRVAVSLPGPNRPLDAARVALRDYSRQKGGGSMAERLGGARLAARAIEFRRRMRRWAGAAEAIVGSRRRRPPHR